MGCHTWINKPLNYSNKIKNMFKIRSADFDPLHLNNLYIKHRFLSKDYFDNMPSYYYQGNYYRLDGADYLGRVYGYPEIELHNEKEAKEFLESYDEKHFGTEGKPKIIENILIAFKEDPGIIITFG